MFIKVDDQGNPVDYPIDYDNVRHLLDGVDFTDENVYAHNLRPIKNYVQPEGLSEYRHAERTTIVKNDNGEIEQLWDIQDLSVDEKVRRWVLGPRQFKLIMTDWTQSRDCPLSEEKIAQWAEYRAKLRNMTDDIDFSKINNAGDIEWPVAPGTIAPEENWLPPPEPPPVHPPLEI